MENQDRLDIINITTLNVKMDEVLARLDKLENNLVKRVEILERWQSWSKGIFVLGAVVVALIVYIYLSDINGLQTELRDHEKATQEALDKIQ